MIQKNTFETKELHFLRFDIKTPLTQIFHPHIAKINFKAKRHLPDQLLNKYIFNHSQKYLI